MKTGDSDGAEMDFGFTGNDLNKTAITNWLGDANGYCRIMYDQSGNGGDVIAGYADSPLLVLNGMNGKPVLHFDYNKFLFNSIYYTTPYTAIYGSRQTGGEHGRVLSSADNNWLLGYWSGGKGQAYFEGWINSNPGNPAADDVYHIYSGASNGSSSFLYEDGIQLAASSDGIAAPNGIQLNGWQYGYETSDVDITDVIMFGSELSSANRALVENSINDYYNSNHASISVAPASTTTYTVTGIGGNGCSATANTTVTVGSLPATPTISASGNTTFCSGGSVVLTSSSATGNVWNNGATTQSITVTAAGNYSVTVTNISGCSASSSVTTVLVNPLPSVTITAGGSTTLCPGATVTLTSSQPTGNLWSNGATTQSISVNTAATYSVVYINTNNCSATASVTVTSATNCIPTTQLRTVDCGKQNLALNAAILCDAVSGATHYDFEFTNLTTNSMAVKTSTANSVGLSNIIPAIQFATQYSVRVRAKVGGIYGNYGASCNIGTVCNPAVCGVPATQLRTADCGKLNLSPLTGQVIADPVAAASHYEFEFRNISTNVVYATKLQTSNVLVANLVLPALQRNTQYNVKVRAYIAGIAGTYGANCVIGFIPDPTVVGVPNTQLSTASCGATNLALTGSITCIAVTGAGSYEWEFKNQANSLVVATKTTSSNSLALNTVTGLQWNTQYNVSVRGYIGTVAGTYSVSCLIGIIPDPAISGVPSTKIRTSDCGKINFGLGGFAVADLVSGAAEYEFEIRNNTTNAFIANKIQASNVLTFSTVPSFTWNTQYKVSVRARISSTWGTFGTACSIGFVCDPAICGVPTTALRATDCGKLNLNFSTGYVVANTIAGATAYDFEITDLNTNSIVSTQTRTVVNLYFNSVVPVLQNNRQYSIRVRASISGVVGTYGAACTVGFISSSRETASEENNDNEVQSTLYDSFNLKVYPNPFMQQVNILISDANNEKVQIQIYDVTGKLIWNEMVNTNENINLGNDFAKGAYLVKALKNTGEQVNLRLVKTE